MKALQEFSKDCELDSKHFDSLSMEFSGDKKWYIVKMVLASIICAVSLIGDNQEGVIGTMILSPLVAPIIGLIGAMFAGQKNDTLRAFGFLLLGMALMFAIGWIVGKLNSDTVPGNEITKRHSPTHWKSFIDAFIIGVVFAIGAITVPKGYGISSFDLIGVAVSTSLLPPVVNAGITLGLDTIPAKEKMERAKNSFVIGMTNILGIMLACVVVFFSHCQFKTLSKNANIPVFW